jgi:hypothetical protein
MIGIYFTYSTNYITAKGNTNYVITFTNNLPIIYREYQFDISIIAIEIILKDLKEEGENSYMSYPCLMSLNFSPTSAACAII